jgi:CBS domain-containing protein
MSGAGPSPLTDHAAMAHIPEFLDLPVDRLMTRRPDAVGPEDPLGDAAGLMVSGGYRHLPVVDPDGRVVGMLSDRDLRARLGSELERFAEAGRQLLSDTVESAMRPNPITVPRRAHVREVLETLIDDRIGALPVTDDADRLVGIVSYLDLLAYVREGAPARPARPSKRGRRSSAGARSRKRAPRELRKSTKRPGRRRTAHR